MESFRHIGAGPHGDRSTVIFKGGRFEGPKLRGEILPGGGGKCINLVLRSRAQLCCLCIPSRHADDRILDWETIDNHDGIQTAHLDTRYNLVTHDGASIYLQTTGTRTGRREVLEKLGDDTSIKADQFKMRLHLTMETGDPRYRWVNDEVFIASSGRSGDQVIYDAYELL